jgi:hypothetical protein
MRAGIAGSFFANIFKYSDRKEIDRLRHKPIFASNETAQGAKQIFLEV